MAKIYGNLERASIEALSADPALGVLARIWWNTTAGQVKTDDGTNIRALLRNDAKAIVGNSGTAANNIRLHRGADGVLQFVEGDDVTAEGSLATALNQLSFRVENYATGDLPAAASAGRLFWNTDLSTVQVDTGIAIKELVIKDLAQVLTLKDFDGGTATDTSRITIPQDTKTNLDGLARKAGTIVYGTDTQKAYIDDGSLLRPIGSGVGGINYILNPDAEVDTTGWVMYADVASSEPVNGTGGSPASTWTKNAVTPLRGLAEFLLTKSANNRQGEGVSYDFAIDLVDINKQLEVSFDYGVSLPNFATGDASDVRVFIYDVDNSRLITPSNTTIQNGIFGTYKATFISSESQNYRLILHIATTNASAWTMKVDNVLVGPQEIIYGPTMTDWQAYTPTFTGFGTPTDVYVNWRQVGGSIEIQGKFVSGTCTATEARISLPNNLSVKAGEVLGIRGNAGTAIGTNNDFSVIAEGGQAYIKFAAYNIGATGPVTEAVNGNDFGSASNFAFFVSLPIEGFTTNVIQQNAGMFSMAAILAGGTRVTAAPVRIGEYRAMIRSGANVSTGADDAPGTAISSANGIRLYADAYNATGTAGQTQRFEIFVGKGKHVKWEFFASAGRTGYLSVDCRHSGGATTERVKGADYGYDSATGIAFIDTLWTDDGNDVIHELGNTFAGAGAYSAVSNGYFDVYVSDHIVPVQVTPVRSEVMVYGANGTGATNTCIRLFLNVGVNTGSAITYTSDATNGDSFTINEGGVYSISYTDYNGTATAYYFGMSKNSAQLTTSIGSITTANLIQMTAAKSAQPCNVSSTTVLSKGDIIRPHVESAVGPNGTTDNFTVFRITKVSN